MSERTITIPYEEYQELRRFRDFADDSQDTVIVEKRQDGMGYSLKQWVTYSKDKYIKEVNEELHNHYLSTEEGESLKEENAELKEKIEELGKEPSYKKMFNTLLFFNFLCVWAYIIGEYILKQILK